MLYSLLALATRLFEKGDIDRAYSYISYALNDANFYNSRFKNTVIARLYPIIESSYLYKLDKQRHNLRFYATMSSLLVLALAIALFFYFRQTKVISRARRELAALTQELISLNRNLDEANLVKERYLGYFMNQCAIYINKLDKYRRDINLKIRNKQFDRLHDLSLQAPGREEFRPCLPEPLSQFRGEIQRPAQSPEPLYARRRAPQHRTAYLRADPARGFRREPDRRFPALFAADDL